MNKVFTILSNFFKNNPLTYRNTTIVTKTLNIATFFFVFTTAYSCTKSKTFDCFSGTGKEITQVHKLTDFSKIELDGRISVSFIQDSLDKIEINCGEKLIDKIEYRISDNTLYLNNKNKCNWSKNMSKIPTIIVHYSALTYLRTDNFYNNYFLKKHISDSLTIEYWRGSGTTSYIGDTKNLFIKLHAGVGNFVCKGKTQYAFIYNSGIAPTYSNELICTNVYAHNQSNANIYINCTSSLTAGIYNSGNVIYSGDPAQINRLGNGNGQIKKEK